MKSFKKSVSLILTVLIVFLTMATPVLAASKVDITEGPAKKIEAVFYMVLDKLISIVGKVLNTLIPGLDRGDAWQNYDDYEAPDSFYEGEDTFDTAVGADAVWSAGFAYASLLEGLDVLSGEYYLAGALNPIKPMVPTGILDDQGVSVYALSDGESGIVVQAVIDGYGIARGDVLKIREKLSSFAEEKGIISINVSALHQHSAIDTLGMGVALAPALIQNPGMNAMGMDKEGMLSGKTDKFMNNLYEVVTETVMEAVADMEEGTLYYGSVDASDLMYDKRNPWVVDEEIHRFRFDPADENSDEIWICEAGMHCTGISADDGNISSDYPYYFKKHIKETTGADVVYVQGAELAITVERDNVTVPSSVPGGKVGAYGIELANRVMSINNDVALDPVLNITHSEVTIVADNPILILAVRQGIVDSVVVKKDGELAVITEIGYMELGNKIGVALVPGEIAPEILWGGVVSADASWTGTMWEYPAWEKTSGTEKLLCFGINNDQVGYILADNDIHSMLTENEELNVAAKNAGSVMTKAFMNLVAEVK